MTNPEKRDKYLQSKYGISQAQWDEMFRLQKGKCPICLRPLERPGGNRKRAASVDHDHKSGRVRGLLDYRCNRFVIGRNSCEKADRVAKYLCSKFDAREL